MSRLPDEPSINKVTIEYEIQLLKILSVGWAISYFMEDHLEKSPLIKKFWDVLFEFSKNLSSVTSLTIGKEVDYFRALKERIDIYLKALAEVPHVKDPASVIGPTFARLCENTDNVHVIMAGNRIFHLSLEGVKHFLESVFSGDSDLSSQPDIPRHELRRRGVLKAFANVPFFSPFHDTSIPKPVLASCATR